MNAPSMVQFSGDTLVVRSVVSGESLFGTGVGTEDRSMSPVDDGEPDGEGDADADAEPDHETEKDDESNKELPQCKIKRNYTCTHCNYYTQNPRFYLFHLKNVHKEKIKIYECPNCLYASKHSQKLQRHVHMVHVMGAGRKKIAKKVSPRRQAPITLVTSPYVEEEKKPMAVEEGEPEEEPGEKMETEVTVDGEKLFKCSLCSFSSRSQILVTRHEKIVHLKKKFFRCVKCNYVTHMKARFTKHVKYHSMPMIKCELCDFRTPYKWNLDRHMKNHQGDGAFKCWLCNFTADIKQSLTVHEMNHHEPPAGQVGCMKQRRNRVGASDTMPALNEPVTEVDEIELLRMEREGQEDSKDPKPFDATRRSQLDNRTENLNGRLINLSERSNSNLNNNCIVNNFNDSSKELAVRRPGESKVGFPGSETVVTKGDNSPKFLCRACPFSTSWEAEIIKHEQSMHSEGAKKKAPPRPIPNLIPIQNKPAVGSSLTVLKIPSVQSANTSPHNASSTKGSRETTPKRSESAFMLDQDLNNFCAQSTSALKDFASLFHEVDAKDPEAQTPRKTTLDSPFKTGSKEVSKKGGMSFFDTLKEKLMVDAGGDSMICQFCGHESKCLSELVRHQKLHKNCQEQNDNSSTSSTLSVPNGNELFSTRCQHCRQRCKTSLDLIQHLKSCTEARKKLLDEKEDEEPEGEEEGKLDEMDMDDDPSEKAESTSDEPHPMENKVFVWNRPEPQVPEEASQQEPIPEEGDLGDFDDEGPEGEEEEDEDIPEGDCDGEAEGEGEEGGEEGDEPRDGEGNVQDVGVETAPGIGSVTYKSKSGCHGLSVPAQDADISPNAELNIKRAYKCPHCTFWAATASRFHVHIVGHLNKKPFECSLCSYRSNWRWDITKHIRLKTARDPNHVKARVLMTDETGRRNYSKYNRYLTLIRVHEPSAESSGTGRRTKAIPSGGANSQSPKPSSNAVPSSQQTARKSAVPAAAVKRPPSAEPSDSEPPKKKSSPENKKTMWKCKKCLFRDSDRTVVLAHVKEHYKQAEVERNVKTSNASQSTARKTAVPSHQENNFSPNKMANQEPKPPEITISRKENSKIANDSPENISKSGQWACRVCSFSCSSEAEIVAHTATHKKNPNATIKCYFCPFYVVTEDELMDHLQQAHSNECETNSQFNDSSPRSMDEEEDSPNHETYSSLITKRYKCANCPYVSNSKSQFLYHRQFHRPRGASFKCNICSYNVTRRHLLHQHLRVHGISVSESAYGKNLPYEEYEEVLESPGDISKTDTSLFNEIPLVWVSKLGTLTKMFKCRHCPHVNIRKSNIQEHEKMHGARELKVKENGSPSVPLQSHHCTECNYVCNNAGVLSSHTKVHQGLFGQVCALVDTTKSDDVQIREINKMLNQDLLNPNSDKLQLPNGLISNFSRQSSHNSEDRSNKIESSIDLTGDNSEEAKPELEADGKMLHFCSLCPARFLYVKELEIHSRFHALKLSHQCESCSYTARQHPHLLAHYKVHTDDYQERTSAFCATYGISPHHPRPRTAVILDGTSNASYAWVVVNASNKSIIMDGSYDQASGEANNQKLKAQSPKQFKGLQKHYSCEKCPAKFFKSVALQYHNTLHGSGSPHKCRSCDYAVKTYGNLIKHEAIHNLEPREKYSNKYGKFFSKPSSNHIPMSGTDLFKQKSEASQKGNMNGDSASTCSSPPAQFIDPEFGILMHGSPEFTYPTYLKNGRMREKRYKCHKCPSAFDKREQYKIHLSLHGAKQRYRCERCDYSVKYYANYLQHMKKHDLSDTSRNSERTLDKSDAEYISDNLSESAEMQSDDGKDHKVRAGKTLKLSMADQQAVMLMQLKENNTASSPPETVARCPYCPYSSIRKDGVGHHLNRHSNIKGATYACKHCDYSVPQTNYMKEHNKLHFQQMKGMKPDAYMKCDRIELWAQPADNPNSNDKVMIFQDKGVANGSNRFHPEVNEELSENQELEKIFVNINTGEEEAVKAVNENCDKENDKKLCNGASKDSVNCNGSSIKDDAKVETNPSVGSEKDSITPDVCASPSDDNNDESEEDFKGYPVIGEDSDASNDASSKSQADKSMNIPIHDSSHENAPSTV
nr:PREDICTED: uncharacterized protein LOC109041199 [Bemisia tabaci]